MLWVVEMKTFCRTLPSFFAGGVLADRSTGWGEVARGGCLFASNFSVTRSATYRDVAALVTRSKPTVSKFHLPKTVHCTRENAPQRLLGFADLGQKITPEPSVWAGTVHCLALRTA